MGQCQQGRCPQVLSPTVGEPWQMQPGGFQELRLFPRSAKGRTVAGAIPQNIYSSSTVQGSVCPPWDADFTSGTAAQALQALTCSSDSTRAVPEHTWNFFRVSGGRSSLLCCRRSPERGVCVGVLPGVFIHKYICVLYPNSTSLAALSLSLFRCNDGTGITWWGWTWKLSLCMGLYEENQLHTMKI